MPRVRPYALAVALAAPLLAAPTLAGCGGEADAPPPDAVAEPAPVEAADAAGTLGGELPSYGERLLSNPYVELYYYALPGGTAVGLQNGENWVAYALSDASVRVQGGAGAPAAEVGPASWSQGRRRSSTRRCA